MNLMKKLALTGSVIAFVMSLSAITGYAQWSKKRSWQNRDGYSQNRQYRNRRAQDNRRWQNRGAHRNNRSYQNRNYRGYGNYGYVNNRGYANRSYRYGYPNYGYVNYPNYQNRNYRYGRISPREARRLQRQRARLYQARNRYARDGHLSYSERRRLANRYQRYRRDVYRDRRDW
jgi:hypothetical protein